MSISATPSSLFDITVKESGGAVKGRRMAKQEQRMGEDKEA